MNGDKYQHETSAKSVLHGQFYISVKNKKTYTSENGYLSFLWVFIIYWIYAYLSFIIFHFSCFIFFLLFYIFYVYNKL